MISESLEKAFNRAIKEANGLKHEYLTLEILLLALLEDVVVRETMIDCGANVGRIKIDLKNFLDNKENFSILSDEQVEELSKQQFVNKELKKFADQSGIRYQPEVSMALQRVIQRAALHIQSAGKEHIKGINVLVAMFNERESFAVYVLEKQGMTRLKVLEAVSHTADAPVTDEKKVDDEEGHKSSKAAKETALEKYCTNLNELAAQDKFDPLIGRDKEVERIIRILCRRRKNNPLLVGDPGVGKTAIAEGLATKIIEGKVPDVLVGTILYRLDMASLIAGTKFRGDFEERVKGVVEEIKKLRAGGQDTVLFIDEIHTIIGAGATSGGSMDASNLLKPGLSNGEIRCLGSTTFEEFRKYFEKDQALNRRFQKIDVDEPSEADTLKILTGLKGKFEEHHGINYPAKVLKMIIKLSTKYLSDKKQPDRSIDVLDEVGAYLQLLPQQRKKATTADVEEVISFMAKVPKESVSSNEKDKLKNLERNVKMLIFGQDGAVEKVCNAVKLARSGIGHDQGPIASFLFVGPTGVGKTELARQLAWELGISFQRFDMSEYMEKHSISKLIGAPPGYVGHEQGGQLTEIVQKTPHCVLLLDEIEKAHFDIFNILLQVMDHGRLTDSNGRSSDFSNVILIMTSNAGANEMESGSIGLSQGSGAEVDTSKRDRVIKRVFSPEFRNRLNAIVPFNKLEVEQLDLIVDKFLARLQEQLDDKKITLNVSAKAKAHLRESGFDSKLGARPLARLIETEIKNPLVQEILFGKLEKGGEVDVDFDDGKITFNFSKG